MRETIQLIKNAVSGERIHQHVREIANYHRIQASTGYRAAAKHVKQILDDEGIQAEVHSYPADGKTWYLASKIFKEWDIQDGWLRLADSETRLADYQSAATSILQKSYPCDYRQEPLDIVMLDKGSEASAYEGLDLKGKLIFVRDHFQGFMDWAIKERGAAGIVTDFIRTMEGVRERSELFDIRNYTSFWWKHTDDEVQTFGYVLTPRQGEELAARCRKMAEENDKDPAKPRYPQAYCFMDTAIYDGYIEVVEGYLPGETDEDVMIVAHLCHPRSSANDNASGVATGIEALKVLRDLTASGKLPPMKRGLRVIFVPEFTGTYAWLADMGHRARKVRAGINLDMVGGKQGYGYGPLTLSDFPHATPSFAFDLAALVLDEVKRGVKDMSGEEPIAMFNSALQGFEGGSDHYLLSDPVINIPTFMLGQWPDFYYHTSGDTPEMVDPFILHKSASIAASYCYGLATLSLDDMRLVMNRARERFVSEITRLFNRYTEAGRAHAQVYERLQHLLRTFQANAMVYPSFFGDDEKELVTAIAERECGLLQDLHDSLWQRYLEEHDPAFVYQQPDMPAEYAYVPVRKAASFPMHLDDFALNNDELLEAVKKFNKEDHDKARSGHVLDGTILFYINGERTMWDIAQLAIAETGEGDAGYVHRYIQLLDKLNLVEIKE